MTSLPTAAESAYVNQLKRTWAWAQGVILLGLEPLFDVWPTNEEEQQRTDAEPPRIRPAQPELTRALGPDPRRRTSRGPLATPPRRGFLSDADLSRIYPHIDAQDIREYAPWAARGREEVRRVAFPAGSDPTDEEIERAVQEAVNAQKVRERPPEVRQRPSIPKAGVLSRMAPVVFNSAGKPFLPPVVRELTSGSIQAQIGWIQDALQYGLTNRNLDEIIVPMSQRVDQFTSMNLARSLRIDPRRGPIGLLHLINQWRDANISLIGNGIVARTASSRVRSRPSMLEDISRIVEEHHNAGLRAEDLARAIQERYQISDARAELIARDQILKLNANITKSRQESAGIREYKWVTSSDERVRPMHLALHNSIQKWNQPPEVAPGRYEHPGGDYQCRCTSSPVVPEWLQ